MVTLGQCTIIKPDTPTFREEVGDFVRTWINDLQEHEGVQISRFSELLVFMYKRKAFETPTKKLVIYNRYDLKTIRVAGMPPMQDCPLFQMIATRSTLGKCSQGNQ
jgi:hypothetical protein